MSADYESARQELTTAWENHRRNGLDFGRVCYEVRQSSEVPLSKGGWGTEGEGLSGILTALDIPRHIFDYWCKKYECSVGKGIPCHKCAETFPSRRQLARHLLRAHDYHAGFWAHKRIVSEGEDHGKRLAFSHEYIGQSPEGVTVDAWQTMSRDERDAVLFEPERRAFLSEITFVEPKQPHDWRAEFGADCEQRHETIGERLINVIAAKCSDWAWGGWAPWRPKMDSELKAGYKPIEDRYRVTLWLTAEQFEQLPDLRLGSHNAARIAAGLAPVEAGA